GSLNDFFLALFFTTLGAVVIVPELDLLLKGLGLAALVLVVTPPVVTIVAEWTGLSARASIESGLLLAQTSEFSMVLALVGLTTGDLDQETFSVIALITVATMTVTPFVATDKVTWKLLGMHPGRRRDDVRANFRDHVLMIGFGSGGMWTLNPLLESGCSVVVIDDDPARIEELARIGVRCVRGDGSDREVLQRAGARKARVILANVRRLRDAEKILNYAAGETKVLVRTFEEADADRIRKLGGIPVMNSLATAEAFGEWFAQFDETRGRVEEPKVSG
ncbi:MAG: NAD-binding protein, partial [Chthoniobacterales bacterium]